MKIMWSEDRKTIKKERGSNVLDLLENTLILRNTHRQQLLTPIPLIEHVVGVLPKLLHVRPDEHLSKLDEVAMVLVVDLDDTPRVATTSDLERGVGGGGQDGVGTDDGEGDFGLRSGRAMEETEE